MSRTTPVIAGIAGTLPMTAYSFVMSKQRNRNFREHHLLGTLLRRLVNGGSRKSSKVAGWIVHLAVGVLFAEVYAFISKKIMLKPAVPAGALLGGLSAIPSVLAWHLSLETHPYPPAVDRKRFYGQLIIAHVVFGVVAVVVLQKLRQREHQRQRRKAADLARQEEEPIY